MNNFVYGTLALGNNTYVKLVDQSHNTASASPECVYALSLIVPAGCTLDLNGLHLYARAVQVSGTVVNGTITQIPSAGALALGIPTPGNLSTPGELDAWTFFETGGRTLTVQVNPGSGGAPAPQSPQAQWVTVKLLDPNNNVLAAVSDTTAGGILTLSNISLPPAVSGTYTIQVSAAAGHTASTGNYIVSAWDVTPNVQSLVLGQQSTGNLTTPFALDQWNFSALANQQVQLHIIARSSPSLAFKLTGPGNYVMDQIADLTVITLPTSGNYTLNVYGANGATGVYSYVMNQNIPTTLASGVAYNGTWAGPGQAQLFTIPVTTAGPLTISLSDPAGADHTELYASFGTPPTRQS